MKRILSNLVCVLGLWSGCLAISRGDAADFPTSAAFDLSTGVTNGTTATPADEGVSVTFNPNTSYPGITWTSPAKWDWSAASQLAVVVTNTGSSPTQLYFISTDAAGKNLYTGFTGPTLEPGKTYTLLTDLTRDSANDSKSHYGMNYPPPAVTGDNVWLNDQHGAIDLTKVASFKIFMQEAPAEPVTVTIKSIKLYCPATPQALYTGIIDTFGQFTRATWPGKITDASDFAARLADENKDLDAHPQLADRDEYGAWTGGESISPAPGFFRTVNRDGKWWMVAPNGHLFLSFGFNGLWPGGNPPTSTMDTSTVVKDRQDMFQAIPQDVHASASGFQYGPFKGGAPFATYDFYGANVDRKYGSKYGSGDFLTGWNAQTLKRMQSWGFNTIANWSDNRPESLMGQDKLPYVVTISSRAGAHVGRDRVPDPYDPAFAANTDEYFQKTITPQIVADPWCVGYYCDNEIRWSQSYPEWGPKLITTQNRYTLAIAVLASAATQPAKVAFRDQMQAQYGTIDKLNSAWGTQFASWDAFLEPYKLPADAAAPLIADMGTFTTAFAAKYATTIKSLLTKYDPNHLYLGCRFSFSSPEIIKGIAAEGGADVVSFNIYAYTLEPALWDFTGGLNKACIVSEYHFGAQGGGIFGYGNGTTCRCFDQQDRAQKFIAYTKSLLAQPAFVGAHWFQYTDEPVTGRNFDGENYNIGFVDVADTPYPLMVDAARDVYAQAYTLHQAAAPAMTQK